MLTLGSNQRDIDFEPEWRRRMEAGQPPGRSPQKPKGQSCVLSEGAVLTPLQALAPEMVSLFVEACSCSASHQQSDAPVLP